MLAVLLPCFKPTPDDRGPPSGRGGDHIVVLGRYVGAMKHSGAPLDAPFCHVCRFHGDKVITFQQFTDTAQWTQLMS